ncbi:MAG: response regulator [Acidobacteria bacterium]|nr:response regulator [Acidobacteriota bacterium]
MAAEIPSNHLRHAGDAGHLALLVVDDDEAIRSLMENILKREGYECMSAADAAEARILLASHLFSLLLSDIQMPGETGLELVRDVRRSYPDTAVIMVTVIDDLETAREALSMDIYGYIVKPVDRNQILIGVSNALRRRDLELANRKYRTELESIVADRTAELMESNEKLLSRGEKLRRLTRELRELNNALSVLLKKREEDKRAWEERVEANVRQSILPHLERLQNTRLGKAYSRDIALLGDSIKEILDPFAREMSSPYLDFTPQEIQVAGLVRRGKTSKEIASILNLSANTIMTHRYKIRSKLKLKNRKQNLRTYLSRKI